MISSISIVVRKTFIIQESLAPHMHDQIEVTQENVNIP